MPYILWNVYILRIAIPFPGNPRGQLKAAIRELKLNGSIVRQLLHSSCRIFIRPLNCSQKPYVCVSFLLFTLLSRIGQTALDAGVAPYYTNRGVAYSRARNYIPALADFNAATTLTNGITTVKILVHMARCRLFLGSPSSALLSIQDALCLDPTNSDVHVLKKSAVELQGHMDSYKDAIVHKRWQMARTSYESCLRVYAQEDGNPPIEVQCWEIEILIAEKDWDAVVTATRCVL